MRLRWASSDTSAQCDTCVTRSHKHSLHKHLPTHRTGECALTCSQMHSTVTVHRYKHSFLHVPFLWAHPWVHTVLNTRLDGCGHAVLHVSSNHPSP